MLFVEISFLLSIYSTTISEKVIGSKRTFCPHFSHFVVFFIVFIAKSFALLPKTPLWLNMPRNSLISMSISCRTATWGIHVNFGAFY